MSKKPQMEDFDLLSGWVSRLHGVDAIGVGAASRPPPPPPKVRLPDRCSSCSVSGLAKNPLADFPRLSTTEERRSTLYSTDTTSGRMPEAVLAPPGNGQGWGTGAWVRFTVSWVCGGCVRTIDSRGGGGRTMGQILVRPKPR